MRIHSKFKDYYDSASGLGTDPSLHYNRTVIEVSPVSLKNKIPYDLNDIRHVGIISGSKGTYERLIVGFCGVLYPCIHVRHTDKPYTLPYVFENNYFYDKESYEHYLKQNNIKLDNWNGKNVLEFISSSQRSDEIFLELNTPIFVIRSRYITGQIEPLGQRTQDRVAIFLNSELKQFEFYKVFDSFSAFQQISMYLGNELVRQDKIEDISDKYRIAQHGFDKYSFKHPTRLKDLK